MRKGDELESISLLAPAKLNLFLRVLNRRKDGYHEIASLMVPVSLFDRVTVEKKERGISVEVRGEFPAPPGEENICYKAARLFLERYGIHGGVGVKLTKCIPSGAGLGGGSSDAASVIKSLFLLYMGELDEGECVRLGKEVGADVPFFVRCAPQVARGIGDVLDPVRFEPTLKFLVVKPGFEVDTGWAYSMLGRSEDVSKASVEVPSVVRSLEELLPMMENDFEEVVFRENPGAIEVKKRMEELGAAATLLTGSGAAIFGIFEKEDEAHRAAGEFSDRGLFARVVENL